MKVLKSTVIALFFMCAINKATISQSFNAIGPTSKPLHPQNPTVGTVKVNFDLLPTSMSFDLPYLFCAVDEKGLKFADGGVRTYDPRNGHKGVFSPKFDKSGTFARVWIEQQSPARIVVVATYLLIDSSGQMAHDNITNDSTRAITKNRDSVAERYYIYPDGTYTRYVTVYTTLASQSLPFADDKQPPEVVHEFLRSIIIGKKNRNPDIDINDAPVTLFRMFPPANGVVNPNGIPVTPSYPSIAPGVQSFGTHRDANAFLINSKSRYRPFTVALPYGERTVPYTLPAGSQYRVATETRGLLPGAGYLSTLLQVFNYWQFRRTPNTIEQIYLHGMVDSANINAERDMMRTAWSWLIPTELQLTNDPNGDNQRDYNRFTFDQTQRAYVVPRTITGPAPVDLTMYQVYDDAWLTGTQWMVNPTFVVPNWNTKNVGITVKVGNSALTPGADYRVGFETNVNGSINLVVWINKSYDMTVYANKDWRVRVVLTPISTTYNLTVNADTTRGTASFLGTSVQISNAKVALNAVPKQGFRFDGWTDNASGTNPDITIDMNAAKTVTANFVSATSCAGLNYITFLGAGNNTGVTATSSSVDKTATPLKTINGSGLTKGTTHSTIWNQAWLSTGNPTDQWVTFDFGKVYPLGKVYYWNSNETNVTNRGINNVTIQVSADGVRFTDTLNYDFSQAIGTNSYAGAEGPDLTGISTRYIRFVVNSIFKGGDVAGLAEVKFNLNCKASPSQSPKPALIQLYPNPATNSVNIEFDKPYGAIRINISDIKGRLFYTKSLLIDSNTTLKIPLNNVLPGTYIVSIKNSEGIVNTKFIKE